MPSSSRSRTRPSRRRIESSTSDDADRGALTGAAPGRSTIVGPPAGLGDAQRAAAGRPPARRCRPGRGRAPARAPPRPSSVTTSRSDPPASSVGARSRAGCGERAGVLHGVRRQLRGDEVDAALDRVGHLAVDRDRRSRPARRRGGRARRAPRTARGPAAAAARSPARARAARRASRSRGRGPSAIELRGRRRVAAERGAPRSRAPSAGAAGAAAGRRGCRARGGAGRSPPRSPRRAGRRRLRDLAAEVLRGEAAEQQAGGAPVRDGQAAGDEREQREHEQPERGDAGDRPAGGRGAVGRAARARRPRRSARRGQDLAVGAAQQQRLAARDGDRGPDRSGRGEEPVPSQADQTAKVTARAPG